MKWLIGLMFVPGLTWAQMTLNPAVTQENIHQTICVAGWTKQVRPGVAYTNYVKRQYMLTAGIPLEKIGDYELDHIVPLEVGGHPYSYANLQLQPWVGPDGARAKDVVETWLKRQVCAGRVTLEKAQQCVYAHWQLCKKELGK